MRDRNRFPADGPKSTLRASGGVSPLRPSSALHAPLRAPLRLVGPRADLTTAMILDILQVLVLAENSPLRFGKVSESVIDLYRVLSSFKGAGALRCAGKVPCTREFLRGTLACESRVSVAFWDIPSLVKDGAFPLPPATLNRSPIISRFAPPAGGRIPVCVAPCRVVG